MAWPDLVMLPIVLPLVTGAALLLLERRHAGLVRWLVLASALVGLVVAALLVEQAKSGAVQAYLVGNWAAPFGIALALDRLSATMVALTALVASVTLLYAVGGDARRGRHFHSLFQFQLMGLNGAFLTADLFNLFVFFEVLLIASYGLLLHGAGAARLRASVHYVAFNLTGSALFLIAVSLLYGLTGTLNMADLAQRVPLVAGDRALLVQSAALLLMVVFSVKAALFPLYFWLPATYGAASAPVAALFALMTKVGVYAILRVTTLIFGASAGAAAQVATPWLLALAVATLVLGAVGALAAHSLRQLLGNVVVVSAGTLLLAVALARADAVAAGLFYLVNSTLVMAALFLLADRVRGARGAAADGFLAGGGPPPGNLLALLFLFFAVGASGMPPLAGFMGKALLLQAAGQTAWAGLLVATILGSSLMVVVAFARAGSSLFWRPAAAGLGAPQHANGAVEGPAASSRLHGASLLLLLVLVAACSVGAGTLSRWTTATAAQLFERSGYIAAVLGAQPLSAALDIRREMRQRRAANPGVKP